MPIIEFSPILIPSLITLPAPILQLLPIVTLLQIVTPGFMSTKSSIVVWCPIEEFLFTITEKPIEDCELTVTLGSIKIPLFKTEELLPEALSQITKSGQCFLTPSKIC